MTFSVSEKSHNYYYYDNDYYCYCYLNSIRTNKEGAKRRNTFIVRRNNESRKEKPFKLTAWIKSNNGPSHSTPGIVAVFVLTRKEVLNGRQGVGKTNP